MVLLEQGYMTVSEGEITAFGYAINQPAKGNEHFTAFEAADITVGDKAIYIESRTGDRYQMMFSNLNMDMLDDTIDALRMSGVADLNKYRTIVNEHEEMRRNKMLDVIEPGELFLRMLNNFEVLYAYYRDLSGEVYKASVMVHDMLHVDCVFIRVYEKVDFRFDAKGMEIKLTRWSSELNAIRIYCAGESFILKAMSGNIWCRAGETTVIGVEEFDGEIMPAGYYPYAWEFLIDE